MFFNIKPIDEYKYQIHKYEKTGVDEYISCGVLPHIYLNKKQALLKIKTLDKNFIYEVKPIV